MLIELQVRHQRIQGANKVPRLVVEGSRSFVFLKLDFDEEWEGLTKTVILSNDHVKDSPAALVWTGEPLKVPEELLVTGTLRVSCAGVGNNGLYLPTKYMSDGIAVHRAGERTGYEPGVEVPGLWEQVLATVGSLDALLTKDKSSAVAAVNEIYGRAIRSIEQTLTSEEDGGVNEFTITLNDGTQTVLQTRNGNKGEHGKSPIIGENGNWFVYDEEQGQYVDTGSYSGGSAPYIGSNGNWWIGSTDSGVSATGPKGDPGKNGVSVTHRWIGTVLEVTSASGTTSADLKGDAGGVNFKVDNTLKLENGILSVNTTNDMEQDNTLPITSAGVFATVGNISAILDTI